MGGIRLRVAWFENPCGMSQEIRVTLCLQIASVEGTASSTASSTLENQ